MSWGDCVSKLTSNSTSNSASNTASHSASNLNSNSNNNSESGTQPLPKVNQNATTNSLCCNGSVRIRLAVYTEEELELLRCGGLLHWRVKDLQQKKQKSLEKHLNQRKANSQINHPMPPGLLPPIPPMPLPPGIPGMPGMPGMPHMMPPSYYTPTYPDMVQFVPVVQYVPVPYNRSQQPINYVPPPDLYNNG